MSRKLDRVNLAQTRLDKLVKKGLADYVAKDFKEKRLLYYSSRSPLGGILYWANDMGGLPVDVQLKIKELENKYDTTVYHITHETFEFGECFDLWCITDEDLEYGEEDFDEGNVTFSYVMNMSVPEFSEFGSIQFDIKAGGAIRVA